MFAKVDFCQSVSRRVKTVTETMQAFKKGLSTRALSFRDYHREIEMAVPERRLRMSGCAPGRERAQARDICEQIGWDRLQKI